MSLACFLTWSHQNISQVHVLQPNNLTSYVNCMFYSHFITQHKSRSFYIAKLPHNMCQLHVLQPGQITTTKVIFLFYSPGTPTTCITNMLVYSELRLQKLTRKNQKMSPISIFSKCFILSLMNVNPFCSICYFQTCLLLWYLDIW